MHIAIVCRGLGLQGSVASVALRQARELARRAKVTLISDSLPAGVEGVRVAMPDLHALRRFRHVFDEVAFARAARRALRGAGADFVLAHGHAASYLAARHAGVPHGLFVHGDIADRPKGTYDARLTAFYRWVTPRAYRAADVVFVLAPPFAELARKRGARRIEIVPHGIDPADLGPRAQRAAGPFRVLFVGRLAIEKGIELLLDAIGNHDLTIAGAGPLEAKLRERASPRVRFLGELPRNALGALYTSHDVVCVPSLSEPFGLVVAEALACGVPVIASNVGGIPTMVEHERNGLLVPPGDVRALSDAIERFANDEALRGELAANAKATVLPRLSWPAIGDSMFDVIREVTQ